MIKNVLKSLIPKTKTTLQILYQLIFYAILSQIDLKYKINTAIFSEILIFQSPNIKSRASNIETPLFSKW